MADLNDLMNLPGAMAAFEYNNRGELLSSTIAEETPLTETILDLLSHMCVANTAIATMQARGWEGMTGAQGFYPIDGFTMMGFEWTTITRGNVGVVMSNNEVDYQAAYDAMAEINV